MGRRIVAIICIMFLLFTITSPISGSIFSYADEPQQEQLSQDEVIRAAIALYLNERKAWITSTTSAPIDAVQNQMQIWIDSYDFWTNHTTIGSAAAFYAQCVVKYNPFRISLKGPAVRALNDLYNWLIDTGKLPNLDADSSGGQTTDNLYNGFETSGTLYYCYTVNSDYQLAALDVSNLGIKIGSPVRGILGKDLYDQYLSNHGLSESVFNDTSSYDNYSTDTLDVRYYADLTLSYSYQRQNYYNDIDKRPITPSLKGTLNLSAQTSYIGLCCNTIYANRDHLLIGNPAYICETFNGVNRFYVGWACKDYTAGKVYVWKRQKIENNTHLGQVHSANVNFDTDNFNKTDPTPPEGDDEVTYTPADKTTGDTYNTYNEYITNYVTKNTVVNNNYQEPDDPDDPQDPDQPAGGTTPPWDGSNAGTLTPDGNGGYNFNLPDLTLPDLDIDWSINGLKDKFPFSIPWDLMAFFTVLNAEPETPEFTGEVDLGISIWNIDIDLHDFDLVAALVRNLEFIAFCIGLIIVTRSIIKG